MKRRGFFIPMFICLGIATLIFGIAQLLGYASADVILSQDKEAGEVLATVLIALPVYFIATSVSWVFVVPSTILGIIYIVKAKKRQLGIAPAIVNLTLCALYVLIPVAFVAFLALR